MTSRSTNTSLLVNFLDGDRSQEDFRRIEQWLSEAPLHVSEFVDQLQVAEDLRRSSLHDDVIRFTSGSHSVTGQAAKTTASHKWRRLQATCLAIACCLALVSMSLLLLTASDESIVHQAAREIPLQLTPIVATLSETNNCLWQGNSHELTSGHHFREGAPLHLLSGVAQISFETGAVSLIAGPAELSLHPNEIELYTGRVSAVVPETATGFKVLTPSSEVIDLGTEFGVNVDSDGASQVHVFSGEVVTRSRDHSGETVGKPVFVTTNNAISYGPDTEQYQRLVADEAAFARTIGIEAGPSVEVSPPAKGPLLLWLASGHWVEDDQHCVTVWRDALCPANSVPNNALQPDVKARPEVVPGAFNGHDVLRFDGIDDFLVTTPFHTSNNQTVAFVAAINGTFEVRTHDERAAPQILNYNGPPQIDAKYRWTPRILEIVATAHQSDRVRLDPFVYIGYRGGAPNSPVYVGEIDTMQTSPDVGFMPAVGEPFVTVYVYNHEIKRAELWLNGQLVGATSAPAPIALTSRKVIGRHGAFASQFNGDIAEMMIYDRGLDSDEVTVLSESLAEKYGVELPE